MDSVLAVATMVDVAALSLSLCLSTHHDPDKCMIRSLNFTVQWTLVDWPTFLVLYACSSPQRVALILVAKSIFNRVNEDEWRRIKDRVSNVLYLQETPSRCNTSVIRVQTPDQPPDTRITIIITCSIDYLTQSCLVATFTTHKINSDISEKTPAGRHTSRTCYYTADYYKKKWHLRLPCTTAYPWLQNVHVYRAWMAIRISISQTIPEFHR